MKIDSIPLVDRLERAVESYQGIPIDLAESIARARIQLAIAEISRSADLQNKRAELALLKIQAAYGLLTKMQ